jgi:hypothetical protein
MKTSPAIPLLCVCIFALGRLSAATPASEGIAGDLSAPAERPLGASLTGAWFVNGEAGRPSFVASTAKLLFAIDDSRRATEFQVDEDGGLLAIAGGPDKIERMGAVRGDFILWTDGSWWSRQPVPEPSVSLTVWHDGAGKWRDLNRMTPVSVKGEYVEVDWKARPEPTQSGGRSYQPVQFLTAHAPSEIRYTFEQPVTEFRAIGGLRDGGRLGSVVFKVKTDSGQVFASDFVSHPRGNSEVIKIKFAPTRSLTLLVDAGENNHQDWAIWIGAQVR